MERTLQSALEKRTRVGTWTSRVYRLERGYLSAWPDVLAVTNKEQPTRSQCLFQDDRVAAVTDQGDLRFRLDFPWDSSKNLNLRASNNYLKKAWLDTLKAALKDITAQIMGTGSVFALGGAASYTKDQAYDEAANLRTNRFVAAYVVDEANRMSYINDLLNEGFHHPGERSEGGRDAHRACAGADAALSELEALMQDFDEEMEGIDELRRDQRGGSSGLNPSVAAPKVQRFCEEHLANVGRLVATRLMLELSPFMESCVARTPAQLTKPVRDQLVRTRKKLDEVYDIAEQKVIMRRRDWFMDIRNSFLDCEGLARPPPVLPPPPQAEPRAEHVQPERAARPPSPPPAATIESKTSKPSSNLLNGTFSAARAATKFSTKAKAGSHTSEKDASVSPTHANRVQLGGGGLSMRGVFRRGSRNDSDQSTATQPSSATSMFHAKGHAPLHDKTSDPSGNSVTSRRAEDEEGERASLSEGSSRSPSSSPCPNEGARRTQALLSTGWAHERTAISAVSPNASANSAKPNVSEPHAATGGETEASVSVASSQGPAKGRRAFAGGLWHGGGASSGADPSSGRVSRPDGSTNIQGGATSAHQPAQSVVASAGDRPSPKHMDGEGKSVKAGPSVGKRRFAGGIFAGQSQASSNGGDGDNHFGSGGRTPTPQAASLQPGTERETRSAAPKSVGGAVVLPATTERLPTWATEAGAAPAPDWAAVDDSRDDTKGNLGSSTRGKSAGYGVAPPSRDDQGQEAAKNSPFVNAEAPAPARRPSQMRPGESGRAKRAFGGGASLF